MVSIERQSLSLRFGRVWQTEAVNRQEEGTMMIRRNKIQKNRNQRNKIQRNKIQKNRIQRNLCVLSLCSLLLGGCGYGEQAETILIGTGGKGQEDSGAEQAESSGAVGPAGDFGRFAETSGEESGSIRVYVCGAVTHPGVVEIPEGSRAEDALLAAGGFREDAGQEAVNLADWVADGQMLYFPTAQEAEERIPQTDGNEGEALVNINTADAAQLCTLPGIGESRAADIIGYREKNGGFERCEDIMKVPGIKTGAYEKIRDKIRVR